MSQPAITPYLADPGSVPWSFLGTDDKAKRGSEAGLDGDRGRELDLVAAEHERHRRGTNRGDDENAVIGPLNRRTRHAPEPRTRPCGRATITAIIAA